MALYWDSIPLERRSTSPRPPSPTLAWPCKAEGLGPGALVSVRPGQPDDLVLAGAAHLDAGGVVRGGREVA